jgi:hypothetical protein
MRSNTGGGGGSSMRVRFRQSAPSSTICGELKNTRILPTNTLTATVGFHTTTVQAPARLLSSGPGFTAKLGSSTCGRRRTRRVRDRTGVQTPAIRPPGCAIPSAPMLREGQTRMCSPAIYNAPQKRSLLKG